MDTRVFHTHSRALTLSECEELGALLRGGGLVLIPTETVYGIAVARDRRDAVDRLSALKERDPERPLTVHLADESGLAELAAPPGPIARRLIQRLWPGPLTLVLPDRYGHFSGFRLPDHAAARALVRAAAVPVAATSANPSGRPPIVDGEAALAVYRGKVEAAVLSGVTRDQAPSTVVRVDGSEMEFLREGAVPVSRIRRLACHRILIVCTGNLCRSPMAEGLLRILLARRLGVPPANLIEAGVHVLSAGTAGILDEPATQSAVIAAAELGAFIADHRSRPLTPSLIEGADEILVVARRHLDLVLEYHPEAAARTSLILPDARDCPDPIGRSLETYRTVARALKTALRPLADQLAGDLRT